MPPLVSIAVDEGDAAGLPGPRQVADGLLDLEADALGVGGGQAAGRHDLRRHDAPGQIVGSAEDPGGRDAVERGDALLDGQRVDFDAADVDHLGPAAAEEDAVADDLDQIAGLAPLAGVARRPRRRRAVVPA